MTTDRFHHPTSDHPALSNKEMAIARATHPGKDSESRMSFRLKP
jgi:hypothetical protein